MLDATQRFSDRVDNYVKYRPGYPHALVALLATECGLTPAAVIADVGSGTGNLAKLFLDNGNPVYGIEPNQEMRQAGELLLRGYPRFISVAGAAEATTLPSASVDFVTAGQAFHWFEPQLAQREFSRILKPAGWVVLAWNDRETDSAPFLADYEQLLQTYSPEYLAVRHKDLGIDELRALFGPTVHSATFENSQAFDYQGLAGRLLSSSYAPLAGQPGHEAMMAELQRVFNKHQVGGKVAFWYTTLVYYVQATG